jgi:hypothetical protein
VAKPPANTTELHRTIEVLILFNDWRNGGSSKRPEFQDISAALDQAISVLMQVENLIQQRDRHNTEIAYRGLSNAARVVV